MSCPLVPVYVMNPFSSARFCPKCKGMDWSETECYTICNTCQFKFRVKHDTTYRLNSLMKKVTS